MVCNSLNNSVQVSALAINPHHHHDAIHLSPFPPFRIHPIKLGHKTNENETPLRFLIFYNKVYGINTKR
ncbi:hypothetical protein BGZ63DRAFT_369043 [Mariannaea sp. PMI_226]|nr:hypothetical protein BGZ63DRAFT_369043 [Mariannaea sp. PMI_226]